VRQVIGRVRECLGVAGSAAALVIDDIHTLQIVATSQMSGMDDLVIPAGRGLGGKVAVLRHAIAVSDYQTAAEITHDFDLQVAEQAMRAMACAPITYGHQLKGVLYAAERLPGDFSREALQGLGALARQAGLALGIADQARDMAAVAVHDERRRMAMALHDSLGATLFSIGAAVHSLRRRDDLDLEVNDRLAYIEEQAAIASATVRRALLALDTPPAEVRLGVALQADCRAFEERTGIEAHAWMLGPGTELSAAHTRELLRITREALLNIEKHSKARSVAVSVAETNGGITVVIADDGVGLSSRKVGSGGLGLRESADRLSRLGGNLNISDGPDGGCVVKAWIPC
jgi:signal transduction histidine kinase